jgi:protein involved in polysaccharide export with SLBB domain
MITRLTEYLIKKSILNLILLLCIGYTAESQVMGSSSDFDMTKLMQQNAPSGSELLRTELLPSDNIVDPITYRVGPGDVLSIQILSGNATEQYISITPENSVLIPRIGEVSLLGKTLSQAKDTIITVMKNRNPQATITVMLRKSRTLYISIKGNIRFPGTYTVPASMRVSTIIRLANQPPKSAAQNTMGGTSAQIDQSKELNAIEAQKSVLKAGTMSAGEDLPSFVARNISILHTDGSAHNVDLEKSITEVRNNLDPTLREGDQIYVPFEKPGYATIAIAGAVRRPITIAYKQGDKASMLLKLGYGFTEDANVNEVYLDQGGQQTKIPVQSDGTLSKDIDIVPGAVIVVRSNNILATGFKTGVAELTGAIQNPGAYTIKAGITTLKDIIEQAGGITDKAYLPLAYIVRREKQEPASNEPRFRAMMGMQFTDLKAEDTMRYLMHSMYRKPSVACDFTKAFSGSEKDNVLIEDGDIIVMPENPQRVYVYGQVNNPGYVTFVSGKTMDWYIQQAGGYAAGADEDLTRIIKGRSKIWVEGDKKDVFVESGDEIYCAPPSQRPPGYEYQYYSFLITAIGGLVATLNVVYYAFIR